MGVGGGLAPNSGSPMGGQALVGFHEDALAQAAVGRAQLLLALVLGLALAADCSELVIIGFVLPAAELQLCIGQHRKHWLGKYIFIGCTDQSNHRVKWCSIIVRSEKLWCISSAIVQQKFFPQI